MFSNNNKISSRQLKLLLIFDIFSTTSLILPFITTKTANRDGFLSILLGAFFAIIYATIILILAHKIKGNYVIYMKKVVGTTITSIICILYMIKLILGAAFSLRLFSELIKSLLLPNTSYAVVIASMLLVAAYGASKGIEGRARTVEILIYIVFIPIVLVLILAIPKVNVGYLLPLATEDFSDILKGGYFVLLAFSAIELLLFATPFIKHIDRIRKPATKAIIFATVMNIIIFIATIGVFGVENAKTDLLQSVSIMQVIKMPGGFIKRQDALMIAFWVLSLYTIINAYIFYLSVITKQLFNLKEQKTSVWYYLIIIYLIALWPKTIHIGLDYYGKYMAYIGMIQSIAIPIFILIIAKFRNINQKLEVEHD